jgi:hypothetical protein
MSQTEIQLFLGGLGFYKKFNALDEFRHSETSFHDLVYEYADAIGFDIDDEDVDYLVDLLSSDNGFLC